MNLSHEMPRMTPEGKDRTLAALADPCGAWLCAGTTATLRRRNRRGVVTVCLQCDGCGRTLGGAMKRADHYYWQDYLEWDETLAEEQAKRRENWHVGRPAPG
jgi:RNase P subunit RPR2